MISKKDELFNWLEQKADFSIADKRYLAQLIHDIQLERPQNLQQTDCYTKGVFHSTDWQGKCFACGEQVFTREPK